MKKLIVTADDFGYSRHVNKAVIRCFREGIATSTSLIANTGYFYESVKLLKKSRNLEIGIHVNLTEFKPLAKTKRLTDKDGHFYDKNLWHLGYCNAVDKKELENEIEMQILKALSSGLKIMHINGHNHVHIFPNVIDAVVKLAKKYGIGCVRVPNDSGHSGNTVEHGIKRIMDRLSKTAKIKILKNRLKTTDAFYGALNIHDMDLNRLSEILKSIKHGTSELMVHPAYADEKGDSFHQSGQREKEIELLTSNKTKNLIKKLKIQLTSFSKI